MNIEYMSIAHKDYCGKMTFADFVEVCVKLQLPVFEVEKIFNPFAVPHEDTEKKMYDSINDYRKSMPDWAGRNYDYVNDRATSYYVIDDIPTGEFTLRADNSSSSYEWEFCVMKGCVVVHKIYRITD